MVSVPKSFLYKRAGLLNPILHTVWLDNHSQALKYTTAEEVNFI
jgi:hypothetical protein